MLHISQTPIMRQFTRGGYRQYRPPTTETDWKVARITKRQLWYIRLLASQQHISIQNLNDKCFRKYGADLATMTRPDASRVIHSLKRSLGQQYKPFHR